MFRPGFTSRTVRGCVPWMILGVFTAGLAGGAGGCKGPIDPQLEQRFIADLPTATVVVFPAFVRGETTSYDDQAAKAFAGALREKGISAAAVADHVPIAGGWGHNQARMFRNSFESLAGYVAAHPVEADYAVLPEYLMGHNQAVGIHLYVVDKHGQIMAGFLLNSHQDVFSKANAKTVEDCTKLAETVFEDDFLN